MTEKWIIEEDGSSEEGPYTGYDVLPGLYNYYYFPILFLVDNDFCKNI